VWDRARDEHSTPREIGWSVAVGVFSGCTPFLGLHMWIALGLATVFRLNRLWSLLGSRVSFTPIFAALTFCEIESGHCLRTGSWAALSANDATTHGRQLLGDWLLGAALLGGVLAAVLGLAAYGVARRHAANALEKKPLAQSPTKNFAAPAVGKDTGRPV
jgi:uncharacterized protein (DUF2062 family)